jgi:hypothetical protein
MCGDALLCRFVGQKGALAMKRRAFFGSLLSAALALVGCGYINQGKQKITCKTCGGNGLCFGCHGSGNGIIFKKCSFCKGTGLCATCGGMGFKWND